MTKRFSTVSLGWGAALWLFGYVLGIVLFAVISPAAIGWVIMPIGAAVTIWVAFTRLNLPRFSPYIGVAVIWTALAVVLDYLLLVKVFHPADGYYKLDVYLYYALTFAIPLFVGWWKTSSSAHRSGSSYRPSTA